MYRPPRRFAHAAAVIALAWVAPVSSAHAQSEQGPSAADRLTAPTPGTPHIETKRVRQHVRALAVEIGPRPTGSDNARRAITYIDNALGALGLTVEQGAVGEQHQPRISVGSMVLFRARTITIADHNLIVRFPGADPTAAPILIMAHYDTVIPAPGAIDNGVGVGVLLELARVLSQTPPPRPIILAWTAAEEQRLAGSRALAARLGKKVGLAVALDLVGWRTGLVLTGLSDLLGKEWLSWIAGVARSADVELGAPVLMRLISRWLPQIERSDHGPFTEIGVPAFQLYHRGKDRVYRAYHTRADGMDQIDDGGVDEVSRFVVALARTGGALPKSGGDAGWWSPIPGGPHVFPSTLLIIIELLLIAAAMLGLIALWRRRPRWRTKHLGLVLAVPAYVAVWVSVSGYLAVAGHVYDHPRPWVHHPVAYVLAAIVLAASLGLLVGWCLDRARKVAGKARYLALAITVPLLAGEALMIAGALELAWIVLWSAAALGGVALARRWWQAWPCFIASLLPLIEPLSPAFLREAVYHGFLTEGMPLGLVLGALLLPSTFGAIYMIRRWLPPLPARGRGALVMVGAALLLISLCTVTIIARKPTCDGDQFRAWNLACEILRE